MSADGLPPLRDVVQRLGLRADRSLGQNFLFDLNLTGRIARAAGPLTGVIVVEIGPGPGGLTRALLMEGADHVIAIEQDRRCIAALEQIAAHYPGRLTIIHGDALKTDYKALLRGIPAASGKPIRIVANLPYNIATPLLIGWLAQEPWPPWWDSLTLMFQREVAERIVATPATHRDYGRLSIITGWRCEAEILFDIPPEAFVPAPKVTSSVVQFLPRALPLTCRLGTLEKVTQAAFSQRRKMLRQSLKSLGLDTALLLETAQLLPTARAEEIPVSGFVALAQAFDGMLTVE
jgi:16S rRNA (adenine1518-N6/adenine1519-N6)-dimethyltransferase